MKKNIFLISFLSVLMGFGIVSCEEGDHNVSNTLHFEVTGGEEYISAIGNDYVDPGVSVTYKGEDLSSEVEVQGVDAVDGHTIGVYNVVYTIRIDGIKIERERTVYVCDPTVTTDISGKYTVAEGSYRLSGSGIETPYSGYIVTIKKIAPGFFSIDKLLGGYYVEYVYDNAYAFLAYNANIQLTPSNEIKLVAMTQAYWGLDGGIKEGQYYPETGNIYLVPSFGSGSHDFFVTLTKND